MGSIYIDLIIGGHMLPDAEKHSFFWGGGWLAMGEGMGGHLGVSIQWSGCGLCRGSHGRRIDGRALQR